MLKMKSLTKKINNNIEIIVREWKQDIQFFSLKLAIVRFLEHTFRLLHLKKLEMFLADMKNNYVLNWIEKNYGFIFSEKQSMSENSMRMVNHNKMPIWVCWYGGTEKAPDLVKRCISSINKHANGHPVYLLTKNNIDSFIELPSIFYKRLEAGEMGLAHFADVLRIFLLEKYGGLWLDATIFCQKDLPEWYFSKGFFTCKSLAGTPGCISKNRWTTFCIGGNPGNILFCVLKNFFLEYWTKQRCAIDYLFFDDAIALAYEKIEEVREQINNVPLNNKKRDFLIKRFSCLWENTNLDDLFDDDSVLFKLGYRESVFLQKNRNGNKTVYSAFLEGKF